MTEQLVGIKDVRIANGQLEKLAVIRNGKSTREEWQPVEPAFQVRPSRPYEFHTINWEEVDWTEQNVEIGRRLGVSGSIVRYHRRRLGKPESPRKWLHKFNIAGLVKRGLPLPDHLKGLDWNKRDIDLAVDAGLSRERIRQLRIALGIGRSPLFKKQLKAVQLQEWLEANRQKLKDLTVAQIHKLIPTQHGPQSVYNTMRTKGIEFKKQRTGWPTKYHVKDLINWRLPNLLLSEIWKIRRFWFAQRRYADHIGSAAWRYRQNGICISSDLQEAIALEKKKAADYFKKQKEAHEQR